MIVRMCDRLSWARKSMNLSQRDFGKKIDVTSQLISMMESGKAKITHQTAKRIEFEFGINHDWLLTGEGDMHVSKKDNGKSPIVSVFETYPEIHKFMCRMVEDLTVVEWNVLEKMCSKLNGSEKSDEKAS